MTNVMQIPLSDIDFGTEEELAVLRVLRSRWLSMGEETRCFEQAFADSVGTRHAIAVANGTAALHLAKLSMGIGAGDAVLQPAVNFVAGANMTIAIGAEPVFVDICSLEEPTISPDALRSALTKAAAPRARPIKAVVVMHYGGYPCRMAEIRNICDEYALILIEDACHGVGGTYRSSVDGDRLVGVGEETSGGALKQVTRMLGTIGDIGCFSFYSNKNMATGEGGMVVTDRDDVAEKVRFLRSHGMTSLTWERHKGHAATYDVVEHGFNYRIDDIRAAIGRAQLKKLQRNNARRRELTGLYWQTLTPLSNLGWTLPFKNAYSASTCFSSSSSADSLSAASSTEGRSLPSSHLLAVVAPDRDTRWRCAHALQEAGIQTSLHYPFIPAFSGFRDSNALVADTALETSRAFCSCVMTLPLFPTMTDEQVHTICEILLAAAGG